MVTRILAALVSSLLVAGMAVTDELPSIWASGQSNGTDRSPAGQSLVAAPAADASITAQGTSAATGGPSPGRAFLYSAIVPGSGEYYAGAHRRAAVFFGLDVAAVTMRYIWTGKGNDIEDDFRAVADAHWNPQTYLDWRRTSTAIRNNSFTHALPCSSYVDESSSLYAGPGKGLGDCSGHDRQQYYELAGKYDQFVAGWDDLSFVATGNPVTAYTQIDSVESVQSSLRMDYEKQRDDSNRYLKRATNLSGLILVNHALSAIDAARTARARAAGADQAAIDRRTRFAFTLWPGPAGQVPMLLAFKPFE
jgi:hypothetical protein